MDDEQIYRSNHADLVRFAAVVAGPSAAEDIVSTVVLRILRRRPLSDLDDARAYLFRAVLNESRTVAARRGARPQPTPGQVSPGEPDIDTIAIVMRLPAQQRAATFLVYWVGMSVEQAAAAMHVRPGTVKRYLHMAREKLREGLHARER